MEEKDEGNRKREERRVTAEMERLMTCNTSRSQALMHKTRMAVTKLEDQSPFPICKTKPEELRPYSIGLELYFLFLKQMGILLFGMSILSIWPMVQNYYGDFGTSEAEFNVSARLSVANLDQEEIGYTANWVANLFYTTMILCALPFFLAQATNRIRQDKIGHEQLRDYAIQVTGLPREALDPEEVRAHFEMFGEVYEVALARANCELLFSYKQRAKYKFKALRELKLLEAKRKDPLKAKSYLKYRNKIDEFDAAIREKQAGEVKAYETLPVIRAFVVFRDQTAKVACMKAYGKLQWCCCGRRYRFRKALRLKVTHPPDPSDILFENLEVPRRARVTRQLTSLGILACIMLCTTIMIYVVKVVDANFPVCQRSDVYDVSADIAQQYTGDTLFCWCRQRSPSELLNEDKVSDICEGYISDVTVSRALRLLSAIVVFIGNFAIRFVIRTLIKLERHASSSSIQSKIMARTLVATFMNTAMITLLVNSNFGGGFKVGDLQLFDGDFSNFSREWYVKVGILYTLGFLTAMVSPHVVTLFVVWPLSWCKNFLCWRWYKTQYELNQGLEGPEFNMQGRAAENAMILMITLIFCGGMPLLIPLAFVAVVLIYWAEKTLILRVYKRPEYVSSRLYLTLMDCMYFGTLAHCFTSLYMYGNEELFPVDGGSSILEQALSNPAGIIMLLLAAITVVSYIFSFVVLQICFLCMRKLHMTVHNEQPQPIEAVIPQIRSRGLESYNLEYNPKYAEYLDAMNSTADCEKNDDLLPRSTQRTSRIAPEIQPVIVEPERNVDQREAADIEDERSPLVESQDS